MYKIENSKIGLKRTVPEDIDLIYEIENQGDNVNYITPYDKKRHLEVIESKDEEHLTVCKKGSGKIVGFIILGGLQNPNLSLEFRRIVIQEKGKGIGRHCLQLVKQYCFKELQFHRLWLDVFEGNFRAIHLYESEGFKKEGKLRDVIRKDDRYRSLLVFSILEDEISALELPQKY